MYVLSYRKIIYIHRRQKMTILKMKILELNCKDKPSNVNDWYGEAYPSDFLSKYNVIIK